MDVLVLELIIPTLKLLVHNVWHKKKSSGIQILKKMLGMVVHAFSPNTWDTEAGEFLSLRPA